MPAPADRPGNYAPPLALRCAVAARQRELARRTRLDDLRRQVDALWEAWLDDAGRLLVVETEMFLAGVRS